MSLDVRLGAIVDEASDVFRSSLRDAFAATLASLPQSVAALHEIARRAYELGYREALASQGRTAGDMLGEQARTQASLSSTPLARSSNGATAVDLAADDFEDLDWEDEPEIEVSDAGAKPEPDSRREPAPNANEAAVDWSGFDDGAENSAEAAAATSGAPARAPSFRIYPHASVATLRQRIVDVFDLGRFQIDVVICRKGDRTRRQLKGSVKLSKYLVEE